MRDVYVDLSSDKDLPTVFGGYIGEHNETKIIIKLPSRMLTNDINKYQFAFRNYKNEIYLDNIIDISDINTGHISTTLTQEQTIGGRLMLNVIAIAEENEIVKHRAKTPIISLKVR